MSHDHDEAYAALPTFEHVKSLAKDIYSYDPKIHEGAIVKVDLSKQSSLDFTKTLEEAGSITSQEGLILWDLDLGLFDEPHTLFFESHLTILERAIKLFTKSLTEELLEHSYGAILVKAPLDLSYYFPFNPIMEDHFFEWLDDAFKTPSFLFETPSKYQSFSELSLDAFGLTSFGRHLKNLHALTTLTDYLHRLGAFLPETFQLVTLFDPVSIKDPTHVVQLLSKERFAHLIPATLGDYFNKEPFELSYLNSEGEFIPHRKPSDVNIGICFPDDAFCIQSTLIRVKEVLDHLNLKNIAYRVIPESLITQKWDGLNHLIYFSSTLSKQGKRMLQGFSAAGGIGVYFEEALGLFEELSWDEFSKS